MDAKVCKLMPARRPLTRARDARLGQIAARLSVRVATSRVHSMESSNDRSCALGSSASTFLRYEPGPVVCSVAHIFVPRMRM